MKKILLLAYFGIFGIIALLPLSVNAKDKDLFEMIIEKIEKKYEELSAASSVVKARGKEVAKTIRFIQPQDQVIGDYSKLHQIALIRHGEPDMQKDGKYTCTEANEYLKCYDSVCIIVPEKPFFEIADQEDVKVFSSPINRALTTAQYVCGTDREITVSPVFREFENKIGISKSDKKKSMKFWSTMSRIKWMMGGGKKKGIESFSQAKKRAKEAARMLDEASYSNPKVLLTAHGFLNNYVKKNLKKMGWRIVKDTGNDYFGTTILVKVD